MFFNKTFFYLTTICCYIISIRQYMSLQSYKGSMSPFLMLRTLAVPGYARYDVATARRPC